MKLRDKIDMALKYRFQKGIYKTEEELKANQNKVSVAGNTEVIETEDDKAFMIAKVYKEKEGDKYLILSRDIFQIGINRTWDFTLPIIVNILTLVNPDFMLDFLDLKNIYHEVDDIMSVIGDEDCIYVINDAVFFRKNRVWVSYMDGRYIEINIPISKIHESKVEEN